MKVYCTVCCEKWEASKFVHVGSYICPRCASKMKRNIPIDLRKRGKGRGKGIMKFKYLRVF